MHNTAFNVLRGRGLIVGFVIMMIISISGNNKWGNNDCVMWVDVSQLGECQDIDWQSLIPDLSRHPPHFSRRNTLYIMHCPWCVTLVLLASPLPWGNQHGCLATTSSCPIKYSLTSPQTNYVNTQKHVRWRNQLDKYSILLFCHFQP